MELNKENFQILFDTVFESNYHKAAREIGVSPAQIHRVINGTRKAGRGFLSNLMTYCNNQGLCYTDFITMPKPLTKVNELDLKGRA